MERHTFPKRMVTLALAFLLVISGSTTMFPQRVHAIFGVGDVVIDPTNLIQNTLTAYSTTATHIKEYVLDPLAWAVSKAVLQSVVNSTVNWINHGFNGAPGFATNLNSTLQAVGDSAANNFIAQLATNGSIKSPFQTQVASAVSTNYLQSTSKTGFFTQNAYTLNKVTTNDAAFLGGNFSDGGWNAWMSAVINPQNNPYGAYQLASNAVGQQVTTAQKTQSTELNWAQGFLSSRGNCPTSATGGSTGKTTSGGSTSLSANSTCQSTSIQTPGSIIQAQLNKSLGSGIDTLVTANQFEQIVNALLGQLTKQIIGGGGGLAGLSQPSAATGGTTYFAQTTPTQAAISSSLNSSFASTIAGQVTQIQQFQSEWNIINNAAQAALSTLSSSACYANSQTVIATQVQPVINEAATSLAQATSSITALENIEAEVPASNSTSNSTTALSQASSDYSTLLSSGILPSAQQISDAAAQSVDTGTNSPVSLYTQMTQLTQAATQCMHGIN